MNRDQSPKRSVETTARTNEKDPARQPRLYHGKRYVYFNSSSIYPFYLLNNFALAPVRLDDTALAVLQQVNPELRSWLTSDERRRFPSIQHLWAALQATSVSTFLKFIEGGQLASLTAEAFMPFVADETRAHNKVAYWGEKANVGVLAKMASNPKYQQALNMEMDYARAHLKLELERAVWLQLLRLKFEQNAPHREVLRRTKDARLIEFERGAQRHGSHWGGVVKDDVLYGDNAIGNYLEEVRAQLCY